MSKLVCRSWLVILIVALCGSQAIADEKGGSRNRETMQISNHHVFNTDIEVNGATTLVRDYRKKVVTANITTGALEPDFAYSIWWVIFNNPQYCIIPYECGLLDLEVNGGNPRVRNSVFYAGGMLADGTGSTNTAITVQPGRTGRELFAMSKNWGLQNISKAEIHLVIRSHGLGGIAGSVADQIGTANDACPVTGCQNVFASVHLSDR